MDGRGQGNSGGIHGQYVARGQQPARFYRPAGLGAGGMGRRNGAHLGAGGIGEALSGALPPKQALLARLLPFWRPGTVVTTNTSGLPVGRIAEETPAEFRRFFLGAPFFTPPRYMKPLQIT